MKTNIKTLTIESNDIPHFLSNSTLSVTLWFTGCEHNCKGCQNKSLQEFDMNGLELDFIKKELEDRRILCDWVVLSGGDPYHQNNREILEIIATFSKKLNYKTFLYTGYKIDKYIKCIDYFKTGKYVENDNIDQFYFASTNQELWCMKSFKKIYWFENGKVYNLIGEKI